LPKIACDFKPIKKFHLTDILLIYQLIVNVTRTKALQWYTIFVNDIESLRHLVVRLFADVYDKLTDLELRVKALESRAEDLPMGYSRLQISELMSQHFDVMEIDQIAWDMNINEDEITGTTRGERARALIAYCERRLKMHELIFHCKRLRQEVLWPQIPHQR